MGIHDRDYYRDPPANRSTFGGAIHPWSVNTWLIVICVAVFLLDAVLLRQGIGYRQLMGYLPTGQPVYGQPMGPLEYWGYFSVNTAVLSGQVWRFVTFQFLHAGLQHIAFNLIALFFFGPMIEQYLGRVKYLAFYLLCGVAGPVSYMLMWASHLLSAGPGTPLIGASAGIFGVLIAAATVAPDATVLVYGLLPVKLRTFAWVLLGIAVYTVFTAGHNAGGEAAHLGGAAVGYWLIRDPRPLAWAGRLDRRPNRMRYRP